MIQCRALLRDIEGRRFASQRSSVSFCYGYAIATTLCRRIILSQPRFVITNDLVHELECSTLVPQ